MTGGLIITGVALSAFGGTIAAGVQNDLAAPLHDLTLPADDGRHGDILLDDEPSIPDVEWPQVVEMEAATAAALRANRDALKAHVMSGLLSLVYDDRPTRLWYARCPGFEPLYDGASQPAYRCQVRLPFKRRPFSYKCTSAGLIDPTILALSVGTRTPLPGGTAPSDLTFVVSGGGATFTGFTIRIRNHVGGIVFDMVHAGTAIADTERCVIMSERASIERVTSGGVVANVFGSWNRTVTAETNDFPVLRPQDAHVPTSSWATAELLAGSVGTPVGEVRYVEAYR